MSAFNASGHAYEISGQNRTLTYNGNPTYNFTGLVPYVEFDGAGDYLSRADEAGLDILGTESYVAGGARGLTIGGWFFFDGTLRNDILIGKYTNASGGGYVIQKIATGDVIQFHISDGASLFSSAASSAVSASTWYWVVGRFTPSTELTVFLNQKDFPNTTGIPAAIGNNSDVFEISGANNGSLQLLDGRASLCFLCAAALSDAIVSSLFNATRGLFRV